MHAWNESDDLDAISIMADVELQLELALRGMGTPLEKLDGTFDNKSTMCREHYVKGTLFNSMSARLILDDQRVAFGTCPDIPVSAKGYVFAVRTMAESQRAIGYSYRETAPETAKEFEWRADALFAAAEALAAKTVPPGTPQEKDV